MFGRAGIIHETLLLIRQTLQELLLHSSLHSSQFFFTFPDTFRYQNSRYEFAHCAGQMKDGMECSARQYLVFANNFKTDCVVKKVGYTYAVFFALWHRTFGHANNTVLRNMAQYKSVEGMDNLVQSEAQLHACDVCAKAKQPRHTYHRSQSQAAQPCHPIHCHEHCHEQALP
jgi:hypothetical protein